MLDPNTLLVMDCQVFDGPVDGSGFQTEWSDASVHNVSSFLTEAGLRCLNNDLPPKDVLISYGDKCCASALPTIVRSAFQFGFDEAYANNLQSLPPEWKQEHAELLNVRQGAGLWSWKPKILLDTMMRYPLSRNTLIAYSDAGSTFIKDVSHFMDRLRQGSRDINVFSFEFLEQSWTKEDLFHILDADTPFYRGAPTADASFLVVRNTLFARYFIRTWSHLAEQYELISAQQTHPRYVAREHFAAHRHDQSLLSLCVKKFNLGWDEIGTESVFDHHRDKS